MASTQTDETSLTVLSGGELFPEPSADPNWSPVVVATVAGGSAPAYPDADDRIYVKPNTDPLFDNASATKGTRSVKFAIGGSEADTAPAGAVTANVIMFQVKAVDGGDLPLNGRLPTVNAQLAAEGDTKVDEAALIKPMSPMIVAILDDAAAAAAGLLTIAVYLAVAPRIAKGIIQVEVNFGYSASN